jgi:phage-related protein
MFPRLGFDRPYEYSYNPTPMKPVRFVGSAKDDLSAFPKSARTRAGHELFMVQAGRNPDDWKPMPTVGSGACEIRVRDEAGAFRVIYVAKFEDAVYVLHSFRKKTRKTSHADLELARERYRTARGLAEGVTRD